MLKIIIRLFVPLLLLTSLSFTWFYNEAFPVPSGVKNMLFYVQRSLNKNTLIYQLNYAENGELNEKEPIKIYWINYATNSNAEELNYIQRKYAYGLSTMLIDNEKKTFAFNFVSYKKQMLYLIKSHDKKYHAYSYFNNRLMQVNRIYVHIEGGSFWTPKVKYIEVSGKDPVKNEELTEKINI